MIFRVSQLTALQCSREGAGIGEGLAVLALGFVGVVFAVLVVAIVSGAIVGKRKGAIGPQILRHLLIAGAILVAVPVLAWFAWSIKSRNDLARYQREAVAVTAWLAPLERPARGTLDQVFSQLLDAPDAHSLVWRDALMASLPRQVGQLEFPLDERDQAALISAAARMRREDDQWYPGAFGGFHDVLDGAIAWLAHAPDLITALRDCGPRQDCQAGAVGAAADWCERVPQRCVQTFDRERLDAVAGLIGDRTWASHNLERIRRIAGETRVSESPGQ